MPDREKVISDIEQQIRWIEEIECHKFPGWLNVTNAMRDAITLLKEQEKLRFLIDENGHITPLTNREPATVKAEIEGGGRSWWYVCSECHGPIDKNDQYCRHCGGRITE